MRTITEAREALTKIVTAARESADRFYRGRLQLTSRDEPVGRVPAKIDSSWSDENRRLLLWNCYGAALVEADYFDNQKHTFETLRDKLVGVQIVEENGVAKIDPKARAAENAIKALDDLRPHWNPPTL